MPLPITAFYAIPLVMIYLSLWLLVTKHRAAVSVSVGHGDDMVLLTKIRKHGNFCEWAPMLLILMILAEANGAGPLWLHSAGVLAVAGRLAHPFGLLADNPNHPLRIIGNSTNILATLVLTASLAKMAFGLS